MMFSYEQLVALQPDSASTCFKGAFCAVQYAVANPKQTQATAKRAEALLRSAKSAAPGFIVVQPLLARALQLQGKAAEALAELEAMLSVSGAVEEDTDEWQRNLVADGLRCLGELLTILGRQAELSGYTARFTAMCVSSEP